MSGCGLDHDLATLFTGCCSLWSCAWPNGLGRRHVDPKVYVHVVPELAMWCAISASRPSSLLRLAVWKTSSPFGSDVAIWAAWTVRVWEESLSLMLSLLAALAFGGWMRLRCPGSLSSGCCILALGPVCPSAICSPSTMD